MTMIDDADIIREVLPVFRDTARQKLVQANRVLLLLEQEETPDRVRDESSEELLRILHTIKGDAGSMGVLEVETLAHELESSIKAVAGGQGVPPARKEYASWFEGLDLMSEALQEQGTEEDRKKRIQGLAKKLGKTRKAGPGKKAAAARKKKAAGRGADKKKSAEPKPAPAKVPAGDEIVRVSTRRIEELTEGMSELLGLRLSQERELAEIQALALASLAGYEDWIKKLQIFNSVLGQAAREGALERSAYPRLREQSREQEKGAREMKRLARTLVSRVRNMNKDVRHSGTAMRLQEEGLRGLQMTPVTDLFASFHRWMRDASRELGKSVEFSTEGESVELDRSIIQQLRDPLIHLLRNALDHGIETPAERRVAGKPEQGRVILRAFAAGGSVVIEIEDDGRGLDSGAIKEAARSRGMVSETELEAMNDRALQSLVFQPGFSTRTEATSMSGRGVGLDAARAWAENLRGRLEWESSAGRGLLVRLRLPLTMATIQVLITRIGAQKFALPLSAVDRVLKVRLEDLRTVEGRTAIVHEGRPVELVSLASVLGIEADKGDDERELPVIVSWSAGAPRGWVVDELLGEQEIVMKNFTRYLRRVPNIAGAAVIDGGEVALVLNASDLGRHSSAGRSSIECRQGDEADARARAKRILVVDDSLITRTMEHRILAKAGYDVAEAKDGIEALQLMDNESFDLVVTDLQMPRMNGLELTRKIKQTRNLSEVPVIMVTFKETEQDKINGLKAGADAYLTKSGFSQAGLLEAIEQLIGG